MLELINNQFDSVSHWCNPIDDVSILLDPTGVDMFDQNGYHLTRVEQEYAKHNGYDLSERREEHVIRQDWFQWDKHAGAHINHSDLFERKGYNGRALQQLQEYAPKNPMLYKLIHMKPKWGIDISIDFVDHDRVFEVFHYEWDDFKFENVDNMKRRIEQVILKNNWDQVAEDLWAIRGKWIDLDFFEQTDWRTAYFSLPPEKFKNVIWKN